MIFRAKIRGGKGMSKLIGNLKKQRKSEDDINGLIEEFLSHTAVRGVSQDTLNSHKYALNHFFNEYKSSLDDVVAIRKRLQLLLKGNKDAYYNKRLNALRQFFKFCIDEEAMTENPALEYKYRKASIQIVDHSDEAIKKLLKTIKQDTFAGLRDYCFAVLLLDTGIRPSEALQLLIKDIDFARKKIHVRAEIAKTREERYLPVSIQVLHVLEKLISYRPDDWDNNKTTVLCTYEGNQLPARGMQDRFRNYAKRIGEEITPYHLRHCFALGYIRSGGNAFSLQRIMGHASLEMTKVYVNLNDKDLEKEHTAASPLQNFLGSKRVKNIKKK